uniref:Auxin-induced protein n=1 Tax=Rhizophora mucronata TaxID=61149 RepID=A0A2P2JY27_RHIMU
MISHVTQYFFLSVTTTRLFNLGCGYLKKLHIIHKRYDNLLTQL